jgi:molybdopterin-binding protein
MTVRHNIAYGLRSARLDGSERSQRMNEVAETMGIKELLQRSPTTLSGGEQQRVALARALVISPELILLDEPLSAVDLQFRRVLRNQLKQLHRDTGATFLHVTHDVDEALQLGQRIGVMLDGQIRQTGTPEELFQRPSDADVADFLGMRNILSAEPRHNGECLVSGVPVHVGERGHQYEYIWIRPEEILLSRERFESSARNQLDCTVIDWEMRDVLVAVRLKQRDLELSALVTYASYEKLQIAKGAKLFVTFKSSAVHCF